jgi:hypothetical protein
MGRRRSPQEKKRLSYAKDRRNWTADNDKSARKTIPRRKRARRRSERHRQQQQLSAARGTVDEHLEADLGERLGRTRRGYRWRKIPDTQLGAYVAWKLAARVKKGISAPEMEQARIKKVMRSTRIDGWELPRRLDR